ncbi:MAG: ABC transporter substrate-binding protein [Solirubrobacteraceae bacterium]
MRALVKGGLAGLLVALAAGILAGCGGSSGPPTLSWYIFPEPSGSFAHAAQVCSQASGGKYKIALDTLPTDADGQRQELVRRLAAKDSSIDIIGMDVTYTPEFAEAGWLRPWTGPNRLAASKGILPGPLATATWKGTIYGAPDNSNTQLLWYRKDLVPNPPKTWAEMIQDAIKLDKQGKPHYIEVQGKQYEGLTVWFNTLVASGGGSILKGPTTVSVGPTAQKAAEIMHDLAISPAADPSLSNSDEGSARLAFESGSAAFELNYPFVYPSIQADNPKLAKQMGYTYYPGVSPGKSAKVTIGGSNLGVSAYSKYPDYDFQAIKCLTDRANQKVDAVKGGLPPTIGSLYADPALTKPYPFKAFIAKQLADAGIRPQTPAYADVTIAIQKALSPPASIDPKSVLSTLNSQLKAALSSGALI